MTTDATKKALSVPGIVTGILYKETIKLRAALAALFAFHAAFMLWTGATVRRLFRMDHAEVVWYHMLGLEQIPFESFLHVPAVTALLLACFQFLPEMRDERLRLSLHLPVTTEWIIPAHFLAGLAGLSVLFLADLTVIMGISGKYFPMEASWKFFLTVLPWIAAGFTCYLGLTLVLLEPSLRLRLMTLGVTGGLVGIMYAPLPPGAWSGQMALVWLAVPLMFFAGLLPAYHYRHRRVES